MPGSARWRGDSGHPAFALRARLRLFQIAPGDLVGIDIDKSAGQPICTAAGCSEAVGYKEVPDEHARPAAVRCEVIRAPGCPRQSPGASGCGLRALGMNR
jgi:hypothetical protein